MVYHLEQITGSKIIEELLFGVRDLFKKQCPDDCDLSSYEHYQELLEYLQSQNFEQRPVDVRNSYFPGLIAPGLYLPYLRGDAVYLKKANLRNANLDHAALNGATVILAHLDDATLIDAKFKGAYCQGAFFIRANLDEAYFGGAELSGADLSGAHLEGTNFSGTQLRNAKFEDSDLTGITTLERAININSAIFKKTKVTPAQEEFLRRIRGTSDGLEVVGYLKR